MNISEFSLKYKTLFEKAAQTAGYNCAEYSFANIFIWRTQINAQFIAFEDFPNVVSFSFGETRFFYPFGGTEEENTVCANEIIEKHPYANFGSMGTKVCEKVKSVFSDRYTYTELREYADYLYDVEKLISVSGKKLHGKRNHINAFMAAFEDRWSFEEITTSQTLSECVEFNKQWLESQTDFSKSLGQEQIAVNECFENFDALGLMGGILRLDGKVIGFAIGCPLNEDTFLEMIEKADAEIRGAYPVLLNQFVKHFCEGYKFVNREDDSGDEGLRRAKLSWYPAEIYMKWRTKPNEK